MYSRGKESFGVIHHFLSCQSKQRKIIMLLGLATGLSLNWAERKLIKSNRDENNYRRQQMLDGQYLEMSFNGVSTICGLVSTVIHQ